MSKYKNFQDMIDKTCDCLETFVGVNNMTHRDLGEWVFKIQQEETTKLKNRLKEAEKALSFYADNDRTILEEKISGYSNASRVAREYFDKKKEGEK